MRLLLVDDDAGLRTLLRTTFEVFDIEVDEADCAAGAEAAIARQRPDVIVLDVLMPVVDGLELAHRLKRDPKTSTIPIALLTGSDGVSAGPADADAFLRKPFSPLEMLAVVERLAGGLYGVPFRAEKKRDSQEQLLLYARDLRHLLEVERGQRELLQEAYHETVLALVTALEAKDTGTKEHSLRVQRYASSLARTYSPELHSDKSLEYGFLLHDIGKMGIPDDVLMKPGPLNEAERRLVENHTVLGEQMLNGVAILRGQGLRVVRSHHERWDGSGYPDRLVRGAIPVGARIFAVADALDAITTERAYSRAQPWGHAAREIVSQAGTQFDPSVVDAFVDAERELRAICRELTA